MAEPQKMIFKTGSVPFKIEKQFYSFIDAYKVEKEKLNTIKKAKNEQLLKKELESKILYNESEILSKLSELEKEFECYMTDYLKKYKEDSDDYNEVSFPVKTAAPLINIIDKIASKFDIIKESQGKRITIYKTKMAPKKETFKEEEKKPINSKNIEKIYNITEKTEENLKKEEEEKSDYQFPPDPIKNFQIKHVLENEIYLKIDPPDDNGDKIFEYNFYDSENTFIKKSHNNEFKLSFSEDLPKFAKNINSDNFFLSFYLTAKNTIGESKMAQIFSIIIRPFKKYQFAISGKDIPLKDDEIGCSFKFSQFYEGGFKNTVNKICLNHSSMMILDGGWVVQWGYSIDSTEFEIDPIKNSELIDEMISTPFYPLKNNNNPILVHSIACGNDFCAVLTMKGEVFTWGLSHYGQLGHSDYITRIYATKIKSLSNEFCTQISCGLCHCLALTHTGKVFSWGFRQAEEGTPILNRFNNVIDYENNGIHQPTPRLIKTIEEKIRNICCGGYHNLALSEKGTLYSWGDNEWGQLGQGTNPEISRPCINSVIPKRIEHLKEKNIINISCGESHSIVVVRDKEEEIFCWGSSKFGQLGLGELLKIDSPQKMKKIWEEDTISVGCGKSHSLFLTKKKEVYGCGETRNGGLGNLKGGRVGTPILIDLGDIKGDLCEVFAGNDVSGILFK